MTLLTFIIVIIVTSIWTFCFTRRFIRDQSAIAGESVYHVKKMKLFGIFGSMLLAYGICYGVSFTIGIISFAVTFPHEVYIWYKHVYISVKYNSNTIDSIILQTRHSEFSEIFQEFCLHSSKEAKIFTSKSYSPPSPTINFEIRFIFLVDTHCYIKHYCYLKIVYSDSRFSKIGNYFLLTM